MEQKLIGLEIEKRKINIEVSVVPKWYEAIGLMFKRREKARALLFSFKKPVKMAIHSYFVFFPFFAVWLDEKGKVVSYKFVRPFEFNILPSGKFTKLIEIPLNKKYSSLRLPVEKKERFK